MILFEIFWNLLRRPRSSVGLHMRPLSLSAFSWRTSIHPRNSCGRCWNWYVEQSIKSIKFCSKIRLKVARFSSFLCFLFKNIPSHNGFCDYSIAFRVKLLKINYFYYLLSGDFYDFRWQNIKIRKLSHILISFQPTVSMQIHCTFFSFYVD